MTETGTISAGEHSLEFTFDAGSTPGAPVLLLLHEGLGSADLWGAFRAELAAATGAGVFAYSREGYGRSSPVSLPRPLDYMQRHAREVLPVVLSRIAAPQIVLVGHSDGATIASVLVSRPHDPRVRGAVFIAPHFFVEEVAVLEIERAKRAYETTDLRSKLARWHADVDVAFRGWNDAWLDPGFPAALNLRGQLADIDVPVLAIQGREDQYGTLAQIDVLEEALTTDLRRFRKCILDGVRHAPHREASAPTVSAIEGFVRDTFGRHVDD